jgi:hypothetical protein
MSTDFTSAVPPINLERNSSADPLNANHCPICEGGRVHYAFSIEKTRVLQCADCSFTARTSPTASKSVSGGAAAANSLAARHGGLENVLAQSLAKGVLIGIMTMTFFFLTVKEPPSPLVNSMHSLIHYHH